MGIRRPRWQTALFIVGALVSITSAVALAVMRVPDGWLVVVLLTFIATAIPWILKLFEKRQTDSHTVKKSTAGGADLPKVKDVTLARAGVNPQISEVPDELYIPRDVEDKVGEHLETDRRVLVIGPSMTGKSRMVLEVVKGRYPDWRFLKPIGATALVGLNAESFVAERTVIWLDELDSYADEHLPDALDTITNGREGVVVVATIRTAEEDRLKPGGELKNKAGRALDWFKGREIRMPSWTQQESDRLAAKDPDLADRLHGVGLPQFLAGAPELDRRVTNATPDQLAVLALTADWRRIGMRREITRDTIDALAVDCLPGVHDTDLAERVKIALDDLCKAVNSDISPLRRAEHGYRLSDHLLDSDKVKETDCPALFDTALGQADEEEAFALGLFAYSHDQIDCAKKAWGKAAANGDTYAMNNLGILLEEQGNTTKAQTWYEKAADNGNTAAMHNLGTLLHEQGNITEAQTWWEEAAANGHTNAMNNLGVLLKEQGNTTEAQTWWQEAAANGHTTAMTNLGALLKEQGNTTEAQTWYEKAAAKGHTDAMHNLGILLEEQGNTTEAQTWYEKAADNGHTNAMTNLGILLHEQGNTTKAQTWWQKAADNGNTGAMHNLGILLYEQGNIAEAQTWWQEAADNGNPDAMCLLAHHGGLERAEALEWIRRSREAGFDCHDLPADEEQADQTPHSYGN